MTTSMPARAPSTHCTWCKSASFSTMTSRARPCTAVSQTTLVFFGQPTNDKFVINNAQSRQYSYFFYDIAFNMVYVQKLSYVMPVIFLDSWWCPVSMWYAWLRCLRKVANIPTEPGHPFGSCYPFTRSLTVLDDNCSPRKTHTARKQNICYSKSCQTVHELLVLC